MGLKLMTWEVHLFKVARCQREHHDITDSLLCKNGCASYCLFYVSDQFGWTMLLCSSLQTLTTS